MESNKKIPPHNVEAEQTVLGAILLNPSLISIASKRIDVDTFYKEVHQKIFKNMLSIHIQGKPIDLIILIEELKGNDELEEVGGVEYITSLQTIVPNYSNIGYYLDLLIDKNNRRVAIGLLNILNDKLYNDKIETVKTDIESIKSIFSNNKSIEQLYIEASDIKRGKNNNFYIPTGFSPLDNMLGGGFRGTSLNILTGVPGSGKSTIINQILAGVILEGNKAFLYSGELPEEDLMFWFNRTVANDYHIEEKTSKKGKKYIDITDYSWNLISKWLKGKFKIYGSNSKANKENILSVIEYLSINQDVKFFVLDNLMTFDIGESDKQYQQQKQLCLSLKQLAKKYKLVILLVAHPKKPAKGEKPNMYDISGASEIVGSADTVLRIERNKNDGDEETKIIVLKNRWGGITNRAFNIYFNEYRKRFYTNQEELTVDYGYDLNKKFTQVACNELPF
ncbi:DnaB-like helicase N-terminal domain-containing protein [Terrisporobacter mayombei]|uniref:DNA 5'-3' helicase n=1 Tax=Terrisporobacter mayombei TaxID=1541 RepID=A0ABY9Q5R8_9FIRM|nr:DnaB-like helicase N-terminal domain-containing protein [Terrisporobacter mayombei]MCC3868932.1 AAA family ATPase [Terrisporobacter mayombei]WMT82934.1 Replicative DNA helicase [Terrisporobacter mayombei]